MVYLPVCLFIVIKPLSPCPVVQSMFYEPHAGILVLYATWNSLFSSQRQDHTNHVFYLSKRVLLIKYKSHISVMLTFATFKMLLLFRFSSSSWVSWFLRNNVVGFFFQINSCSAFALLSSSYLFIAATQSAFIKLLTVLLNYACRNLSCQFFVTVVKRAVVANWQEHSPPTNVDRVRFPD